MMGNLGFLWERMMVNLTKMLIFLVMKRVKFTVFDSVQKSLSKVMSSSKTQFILKIQMYFKNFYFISISLGVKKNQISSIQSRNLQF